MINKLFRYFAENSCGSCDIIILELKKKIKMKKEKLWYKIGIEDSK